MWFQRCSSEVLFTNWSGASICLARAKWDDSCSWHGIYLWLNWHSWLLLQSCHCLLWLLPSHQAPALAFTFVWPYPSLSLRTEPFFPDAPVLWRGLVTSVPNRPPEAGGSSPTPSVPWGYVCRLVLLPKCWEINQSACIPHKYSADWVMRLETTLFFHRRLAGAWGCFQVSCCCSCNLEDCHCCWCADPSYAEMIRSVNVYVTIGIPTGRNHVLREFYG